jgi:hypothetical protein
MNRTALTKRLAVIAAVPLLSNGAVSAATRDLSALSPKTKAQYSAAIHYVKTYCGGVSELLQTAYDQLQTEAALIDGLCGVVLTALSSMPARCAPRGDLMTRRAIERVVFEVRTEIADIAQKKADEYGEPPC